MKTINKIFLSFLLVFSFTILNGQITTFPHKTDFEGGFGDWKNSIADNFDFTHKVGATTPSGGTGPQTLPYGGNNSDGYVFIESSSPRVPGDQAWLECQYDFSAVTTASF